MQVDGFVTSRELYEVHDMTPALVKKFLPTPDEEAVFQSSDGEDEGGCSLYSEVRVNTVLNSVEYRRCCTARSKSLTSLCRLQSHPAQYVSGIPSAAILLSISHPIRCSTRCLANVRARISGPMIAL